MEDKRIYKYRLDFYYKTLIVYLLFFIIYIVIKGNFFEEKFVVVFQDPIIYICLLFIIFFFIVLIMHAVKAKEIIFEKDRIIMKNRFGQREIKFNEIMAVRLSRRRKRRVDDESAVRIARLKLRNRKRYLRIRLSEFYDTQKLMNEFRNISKMLNG